MSTTKPSENERRHTEVQQQLAGTDVPRSALGRYWSGSDRTNLEREHAREEAAIEKRLARMRRPGFAVLQTQ